MSKTLEIKNCSQCPFAKENASYSMDGFDRGNDWYCSKTRQKNNIVEFIERPSEWKNIEIPTWCPLNRYEDPKKLVDNEDEVEICMDINGAAIEFTEAAKPIKPTDIKISIPKYVIKATNELIKEKFTGKGFAIDLKELVDKILTIHPMDKDQLFKRNELDIEDIYSEFGWDVTYNTPNYNADHMYEPYFTFNVKSNK